MKEEDDDEVIREIPVYSSETLSEKLYLFQYPSETAQLCDCPVIASSIKWKHRQVKLDLKLDTKSHNYDEAKGERIATLANGEPSNDPKNPTEKYFSRDIMDRVRLESRLAVPDTTNYVAGILHNQQLHLTPLRSIIHLRRSLNYLDRGDKPLDETGSGDEDEEEAKQVTVKFARQENDRYKLAKERSFNFQSKRSAEEPWRHTNFHSSDSNVAKMEREWLLCNKTNKALVEHEGGKVDIERQIALLNLGNEDMAQGDDPLSIEDLKKLPVAERVRNLIREVKLLSFGRLISLLELGGDIGAVLKCVQQVAVLVQGNWVARSDLLYKKDTGKAAQGQISPELMCRGRDFILHLFTQQRYVDRLKVSSIVKISPENVHSILSDIACLRIGLGWELLLPPDKEFPSKYPEVVQRQQLQWDMKQKQLREAFQASPNKTRRKSTRDSSFSDNDVTSEGSPKRKHRRKSRSIGLGSDNDSGTEKRS